MSSRGPPNSNIPATDEQRNLLSRRAQLLPSGVITGNQSLLLPANPPQTLLPGSKSSPSTPTPSPGLPGSMSVGTPLSPVDEHHATPTFPNRPRAGTLPTTTHLTPLPNPWARFPSSTAVSQIENNPLGYLPNSKPATGSSTSFINNIGLSQRSSGSNLTQTSTLPPLSVSSAAARLRSGSLTLPSPSSASLNSAFGTNVFSSDWGVSATNPSRSSSQLSRSQHSLSHSAISSLGNSYAVREHEETASQDAEVDSHLRTLGYLGLENDSSGDNVIDNTEAPRYTRPHPSATISGIPRSGLHRLSSSLSINLDHDVLTRGRSNTVAAFPKTNPPNTVFSTIAPLSRSTNTSRANLQEMGHNPSQSLSSIQHRSSDSIGSGSHSSGSHPGIALNGNQRRMYQHDESSLELAHDINGGARGRAATISILDEKGGSFMRKRAGTTIGVRGLSNGDSMSTTSSFINPSEEFVPDDSLTIAMQAMGISSNHPGSGREMATNSWFPPPYFSHESSDDLNFKTVVVANPNVSLESLVTVFGPYGELENVYNSPEKFQSVVIFRQLTDARLAVDDTTKRLKWDGSLREALLHSQVSLAADGNPAPDLHLSYLSAPFSDMSHKTLHQQNMATQHFQPNLGDYQVPSRALWVGAIPPNLDVSILRDIFAPFGAIESCRVVSNKSCGFVNFHRVEDSVNARQALHGRELLGGGTDPVKINFAKAPTNQADTQKPNDHRKETSFPSPTNSINNQNGSQGEGSPTVGKFATYVGTLEEVIAVMLELCGPSAEHEEDVQALKSLDTPPQVYSPVKPVTSYDAPRIADRFDQTTDGPRFRDAKRRLELSQADVEEICDEWIDDFPALSIDYSGNTMAQKMYEQASLDTRLRILDVVAPYFASMGTQKHGTWVVQRIIDFARTDEEYTKIVDSIKAYAPSLLLNDLGNYVIQKTCKFGRPYKDFMFDALVDECCMIGMGRFGARGARQTLELSKQQDRFNVKRVSVAIILNCRTLVSSPDGALLVTWLLESCTYTGRFRSVAKRLLADLPAVLSNKPGLTILLKIINQRIDKEASEMVINALFDPNSSYLETITCDRSHGPSFILAILQSAYIPDDLKRPQSERIKATIISQDLQTESIYKKLVDELKISAHPILSLNPSRSPVHRHGNKQQAVQRTSTPTNNGASAMPGSPFPSITSSWASPMPGFYPPFSTMEFSSYGMGYPGQTGMPSPGFMPYSAHMPNDPRQPSPFSNTLNMGSTMNKAGSYAPFNGYSADTNRF